MCITNQVYKLKAMLVIQLSTALLRRSLITIPCTACIVITQYIHYHTVILCVCVGILLEGQLYCVILHHS